MTGFPDRRAAGQGGSASAEVGPPAPSAADSAAAPANGAAAFEEQRGFLFALAYRLLGSVADAEDAVQDAWLRWSAQPRAYVAQPRAYLARVVTNTALNRLRSARARRESYVGPWLPEPLLTEPGPDAGERAELAESVSLAMLVVLESLTPAERAAFVLREVFGFSYDEVAAALGKSETAVRQLAHRAREHVQARRPRFDVDDAQREEVTARFLAAAEGGDMAGLMQVLAPDVVLTTDGGGKAKAALRPITGADKVARFFAAVARQPYMGVARADMTITLAEVNGDPGVVIWAGDRVLSVAAATIAGGRVTAVHVIANPEKLRALAAGRTITL